jgi:autotransporter-associated beta strand protein
MQGLTNTYVKASGAVIDTNGNDISIAQALLDGAGGGGLTKNGAGALTLTAANTFTGSTAVNGGSLVVNGSLAGGVAVAAGSTLAGSGSVGAISGAGSVGPGNSPGILTATSVDPSSNMSFAFELTGAAPAYGSPTNSVNDLLWLTGGTPFTTSLTSANTVSLYLTPAAAEAGTVTGGFFTAGQVDFLTSIQGAAFSYFVQDPNGTFPYGGQNYKTLAQYDPAKSVTISTVAANGGQVMQMVVVPEPGALVLAGVGMAIAAWMARRRQA